MYITLDKAKTHLNIDSYYIEDDDYIISLISAAEQAVAKRLNVSSLINMVDTKTGYISDDVAHSILLLVGTWYNNREAVTSVSANKLPYAADFLFDLNKNYSSTF